MASALRNEISHLLRLSTSSPSLIVRWKKKPPKWRDPADISWAAPLLEKLKQKQQAGGHEEERPPAMLHMVSRIKKLGGRPHWEKNTIKALGLDVVPKYQPVVHKNSPQVNKMLASVKHLVKIVPVTFPHGLPTQEADLHHSVLHEDGSLEVKKTLHPLEECQTRGEDGQKDVWKMDEETVHKATVRVLEQFSLSREYFPAKYVYKYNQDGKEHRYFGNQNIGNRRQEWH